jgi:hypothetical protein
MVLQIEWQSVQLYENRTVSTIKCTASTKNHTGSTKKRTGSTKNHTVPTKKRTVSTINRTVPIATQLKESNLILLCK